MPKNRQEIGYKPKLPDTEPDVTDEAGEPERLRSSLETEAASDFSESLRTEFDSSSRATTDLPCGFHFEVLLREKCTVLDRYSGTNPQI